MNVTRKSENYVAFFNILSTVIVAGVSFFTIPIFTRMLSTEGYGVVSVYEAWVQIFVIFIGLKADGSIASASANLPEEEQNSYQFSSLVISFVSFGLIFASSLLFIEQISAALSMTPLLVILLLFQSFGTYLVSFFSMRCIFKKEARLNFFISVGICLSTTLSSVLLILLLNDSGMGAAGRVVGECVPNFVLGTCLVVYLKKRFSPKFDARYLKFCLTLSVPLIFNGLSQQLLSQSGKIAVQQCYGDAFAGIFGIGVTTASLITYIYTALNNAFVPFMYEDLAGKSSEEVKQRHFKNYFGLFTLGAIAFSLMAPEVLKLMSTDAYLPALNFLPILIIGKYCVFLYSFPVNYEFYKMQTRSIAVGTILAAILNVALCFLLVPSFGMLGASIAQLIAYLGLFLFHFCIARFRLGDYNYKARYYIAGLFVVSFACLAYYPLSNLALLRWLLGLISLAFAFGRVIRTRTIF